MPVTYSKLKQYFAWPGMKTSVHNFVKACTICQQAKPDRSKYPGLLQPLLVPHSSLTDSNYGLPHSSAYNSILVVVDKFTKYAHFIPLIHPFNATKIAQIYLDNIYKLHGMPQSIISDRDNIFTSTFWQALFKLTNTNLCMSSAYHPQSDGRTKRVNQCLETFLRCFVHACPKKWKDWLSVAEF